ncbi:transcriptional regulator, AraC family [Chitinophaga costaii]|uniref:Transcriptional regulator, AraC family n=1 Tax=Chitinophaga costaii TaxID=1335309 RepID=A0A1C4FZA2_9BACT|nr:helix-turn-helix domain-containing protein [Chitinophaga costaii]PUZ20948.1 AraC family transcriptional regulator [Chitinophaga costaii]SCC61258.1 transcriptional regulator, AraC family [Chitinophaga costaii]
MEQFEQKKDDGSAKKHPKETIIIFTEKQIGIHKEVLNKPFRAGEGGFFIVTQGFIRFQCNLETITCSVGRLYFILQQSVYVIEEISEDFAYTGIVVNMDFLLQNGIHATGSEMFLIAVSGMAPPYSINKSEMHVLRDLLLTIERKLQPNQSPYFKKEVLQHMVLAVMFEATSLFRKYNDITAIKLNRKEDLTGRFLNLLQKNVKSERGLQFYATTLSVTTGHLTKVIKQVIGKNASELIDAAVITEAKMLLGNPQLGVTQVAEELQFSDQSFFGKYFKKHTGMSPTAYKKWVRNGDNNLF